MKSKSIYKCSNCGYESAKWYGKCPSCDNWNTLGEVINSDKDQSGRRLIENRANLQVETFGSVLKILETQKEKRFYPFNNEVLNNFWNNGLVSGSLTLLAGEPGLGKSTLALQILRSLILSDKNLKLLYVTAEESVFEVARRSKRLEIPKEIMIIQSNNFEQIEKTLENPISFDEDRQQQSKTFVPEVVVIDSIQTVFSTNVPSSPGSVSQVSYIANQFLSISKSKNISIVLIGHVTKEGQVAGPKTLEHLVDSVLMLESSESNLYRTLTFSKHRYGSVENQLLLKMKETGLDIITDPSLALLENLESGVGVCYGLAVEKNLPMVVEVQALVSKPLFGEKAFGRREAIGVKGSKLNTILAICEKYLDLELKNRDVYLQISGMPKNTVDESMDLPMLIAILSSLYEVKIENFKLFKTEKKVNTKDIFAGRLTLSGNLRLPTKEDIRSKSAKKLKFSYNPKIEFGDLKELFKKLVR